MITGGDAPRDLSRLVVPLRGSLEATGDLFEPFRLADPAGGRSARRWRICGRWQASGRPAATQRSYGMDLLRWFRFLWAVEVPWDQATRAEARDFLCWIQLADKPSRPHWRYPGGGAPGRGGKRQAPGSPNPVTGKPSRGRGMRRRRWRTARPCCGAFTTSTWRRAPGRWSTRSRWPGAGGAAACASQPDGAVRRAAFGRYRPRAVQRMPRQIPDERFDELFARLGSHRDRALVAFWVSTGARAWSCWASRRGDADPGKQLITVIRKGTRHCSSCRPPRTRSCGCGCIRRRWRTGARRAGRAVVVDVAAAVPGAFL